MCWITPPTFSFRPPHTFDITDALRPGDNEIRVRVANLVNNNYGERRESGLLGPVTIRAAEAAP